MRKLLIFVLFCSVGTIQAQEVQNIDSLINEMRFGIDTLHYGFNNIRDAQLQFGYGNIIIQRYKALDTLTRQKIACDSIELVKLRKEVARLEPVKRENERLKFLMNTDSTAFLNKDRFDKFDVEDMPEVQSRYSLFYAICELRDNIESVKEIIDKTKDVCKNVGASITAATWEKNIGEQLDSAREIIIKIRSMDKSGLSDSQRKYYETLVDRYNEYRFMTYDVEE